MPNHPNRGPKGPSSNPLPAEIRVRREAVGLSQTAAGARVHTTCRVWQQWEAGDRRMHPAFWELFCIKSAPASDVTSMWLMSAGANIDMGNLRAIETQYKGYRFRSRLEARWAVFFDARGVNWEYEVEGFELPGIGRYLPDFWLPDAQMFVEVKPSGGATEDDHAKITGLCLLRGFPVFETHGQPDHLGCIHWRKTVDGIRQHFSCAAFPEFWPGAYQVVAEHTGANGRIDHDGNAYLFCGCSESSSKNFMRVSLADADDDGAISAAKGARFELGEVGAKK